MRARSPTGITPVQTTEATTETTIDVHVQVVTVQPTVFTEHRLVAGRLRLTHPPEGTASGPRTPGGAH